MKITILGTGTSQGIPVIGCHCPVCRSDDPCDIRLRTSLLVESGTTNLVVDTGPDFRQQMLRHGVDHLEGALMTHEHNDHVAGLDDIRPYNFISQQDFPFYGLPRVLDNIRERFAYVFAQNKYPGSPSAELIPIQPWDDLIIGDICVTALPVLHGKLDILGFCFGRLAYFTDVKFLESKVIDFLCGIDVLIINSLHHRSHHSHLNLEEALEMIEKIQPQNAFLTHISHTMGLHREVNETLPQNVKLAYDGMSFET